MIWLYKNKPSNVQVDVIKHARLSLAKSNVMSWGLVSCYSNLFCNFLFCQCVNSTSAKKLNKMITADFIIHPLINLSEQLENPNATFSRPPKIFVIYVFSIVNNYVKHGGTFTTFLARNQYVSWFFLPFLAKNSVNFEFLQKKRKS